MQSRTEPNLPTSRSTWDQGGPNIEVSAEIGTPLKVEANLETALRSCKNKICLSANSCRPDNRAQNWSCAARTLATTVRASYLTLNNVNTLPAKFDSEADTADEAPIKDASKAKFWLPAIFICRSAIDLSERCHRSLHLHLLPAAVYARDSRTQLRR